MSDWLFTFTVTITIGQDSKPYWPPVNMFKNDEYFAKIGRLRGDVFRHYRQPSGDFRQNSQFRQNRQSPNSLRLICWQEAMFAMNQTGKNCFFFEDKYVNFDRTEGVFTANIVTCSLNCLFSLVTCLLLSTNKTKIGLTLKGYNCYART